MKFFIRNECHLDLEAVTVKRTANWNATIVLKEDTKREELEVDAASFCTAACFSPEWKDGNICYFQITLIL